MGENVSDNHRVFRPVTSYAAILLIVGSGLALAGCQRSLKRNEDYITQYDRYDALRGERPPQYVVDEYGTRRPNLRGRLLRNR
ncbi:MAG: hypothetical protein AAGB51_08570 [Planctomycetota bacterium]